MTKGLVSMMLAATFLAGCSPGGLKFREYQIGKPTNIKPTPTPTPGMDPWFDRLHAKILAPKCVACHKPPNPKAKVDLTTYESIMATEGLIVPKDPENSALYSIVQTNMMPPRPLDVLPNEDKEALFNWITAGAPKEVPLR
ncbi:MAG: c-type cytochrome domain-containing protein [Bdellovibrionia bacterium]